MGSVFNLCHVRLSLWFLLAFLAVLDQDQHHLFVEGTHGSYDTTGGHWACSGLTCILNCHQPHYRLCDSCDGRSSGQSIIFWHVNPSFEDHCVYESLGGAVNVIAPQEVSTVLVFNGGSNLNGGGVIYFVDDVASCANANSHSNTLEDVQLSSEYTSSSGQTSTFSVVAKTDCTSPSRTYGICYSANSVSPTSQYGGVLTVTMPYMRTRFVSLDVAGDNVSGLEEFEIKRSDNLDLGTLVVAAGAPYTSSSDDERISATLSVCNEANTDSVLVLTLDSSSSLATNSDLVSASFVEAVGDISIAPGECKPLTVRCAVLGDKKDTNFMYYHGRLYAENIVLTVDLKSNAQCGTDTLAFTVKFNLQDISCSPPLTAPQNGSFSGTNFTTQTIKYACDTGYTLVGAADTQCLSNGEWSEAASPQCQPDPCSSLLAAPANGAVSSTSGRTTDVSVFTCDDGYTLFGAGSTTCTPSGEWSHEEPDCVNLTILGIMDQFAITEDSEYTVLDVLTNDDGEVSEDLLLDSVHVSSDALHGQVVLSSDRRSLMYKPSEGM